MAAVLTKVQRKLNGEFTPEIDLFPYAAIIREALALQVMQLLGEKHMSCSKTLGSSITE